MKILNIVLLADYFIPLLRAAVSIGRTTGAGSRLRDSRAQPKYNEFCMEKEASDPWWIYKKLKIASDLYDILHKFTSYELRLKKPDASDEEIKRLTIELIERAFE